MIVAPPAAMHRIEPNRLASYLRDDGIARLLGLTAMPTDARLTCQRWLRETPAKRYAAMALYGDLLVGPRLRVLDVGGGLSSLTRILAERHDYCLIDLMAHDGAAEIETFLSTCPPFQVMAADWRDALDGSYDVVVAADLFPNVDQGLSEFLEAALPHTREIRLSLTWHRNPVRYRVKRLDADEIMCMVSWDGAQIARALRLFEDLIVVPDMACLDATEGSVYPNGRQVCYVRLRGGADA
jgi:hypothetical protein